MYLVQKQEIIVHKNKCENNMLSSNVKDHCDLVNHIIDCAFLYFISVYMTNKKTL